MATTDIAKTTVARQREMHDLMEKFIGTRRRAFIPRAHEIAAEAGIGDAALAFLAHLRQIADGDFIPIERLRHRAVYSTREGWRPRLAEIEVAGLAEEKPDGWRLTPRGSAVVKRVWGAIHEQLRSLPLPAEPLRRTVQTLKRIVGDAKADEYDRLTMIRRSAPADREHAPDAELVEQLMFETCVLLDDGHIAAWKAAGYSGPALDVMTRVWYGTSTRDALVDALKTNQEAPDVDRHIEELVRRGDLTRDGEAVGLTPQGRATRERIEAETDRRGLARWPSGDDLERLHKDVEALVAVLPPEDQLPNGPTH